MPTTISRTYQRDPSDQSTTEYRLTNRGDKWGCGAPAIYLEVLKHQNGKTFLIHNNTLRIDDLQAALKG